MTNKADKVTVFSLDASELSVCLQVAERVVLAHEHTDPGYIPEDTRSVLAHLPDMIARVRPALDATTVRLSTRDMIALQLTAATAAAVLAEAIGAGDFDGEVEEEAIDGLALLAAASFKLGAALDASTRQAEKAAELARAATGTRH